MVKNSLNNTETT